MNLLIPHGFETNYVVGFARGLAANGVSILVVSDDKLAPLLSTAGIAQINLRGSVDPKRPYWRKAGNLIRYYLNLLWVVFRNRGATIHFCGLLPSRMILLEGLFLPMWFRLWSGRYVHTVHNALPHSRDRSWLFRCAYRWIYLFPSACIAHTVKVARQLELEFAVAPHRIVVISIGLNTEVPATEISQAEARLQLKLPPTEPIALFFGKVEPYKGVDRLAETWEKLQTKPAHLVIVGSCLDARYRKRIRESLGNSFMSASMEWREGFVPNESVATWFRACDVVVLPYRHIYQSGVVFLCLRFGIPIVATNVGSLAEYIDGDAGVIADTEDPAGIAAALDRFFSNATRFRRDVISDRAQKYSWERQCAAIKHLYH